MSNVTELDAHRPHVCLPGVERVHVIPREVFERLASGTMRAADVEDFDDILPTIVSEWLSGL